MPIKYKGPRNEQAIRDAELTPSKKTKRYPRNEQSHTDMIEREQKIKTLVTP